MLPVLRPRLLCRQSETRRRLRFPPAHPHLWLPKESFLSGPPVVPQLSPPVSFSSYSAAWALTSFWPLQFAVLKCRLADIIALLLTSTLYEGCCYRGRMPLLANLSRLKRACPYLIPSSGARVDRHLLDLARIE